jgi:hypothetical protein
MVTLLFSGRVTIRPNDGMTLMEMLRLTYTVPIICDGVLERHDLLIFYLF